MKKADAIKILEGFQKALADVITDVEKSTPQNPVVVIPDGMYECFRWLGIEFKNGKWEYCREMRIDG